jgi:hypothetical protein
VSNRTSASFPTVLTRNQFTLKSYPGNQISKNSGNHEYSKNRYT